MDYLDITSGHLPPGANEFVPLFPRKDLMVGVAQARNMVSSLHHAHTFMEIAVIEYGKATQSYVEAEFDVCQGDVFVVHPDLPHTILNTRDLNISNICFMDDGSIPMLSQLSVRPGYQAMFNLEPTMRKEDDPGRRLKLDFNQLATVLSLVERLNTALHTDGPDGSLPATIHFLELITFLCESYEGMSAPGSRILTQLSLATAHIDAHFREYIGVEDLARAANMSLRSFQRHFQQTFKISPTRFVLKRRLEEARKLLRSTNTSISSIAFDVGFQDPAYFSRTFREETGISPKEYRG